MSTGKLKYLSAYAPQVTNQVEHLIETKQLAKFILDKYPDSHNISASRPLYDYTMAIKNDYLRKSGPLSKVVYDDKIHVIKDALGLHTFISRVQGKKLKAKNEIRISTLFKRVPVEFLRMIVVHELAHLKEKAHDKAFYQLCQHMEPDYHQLEFDLRVYLTQLEIGGPLY
ncbi:MAG: putative metal-dependent hydrolase [Phenylobacterium sp.]|jgi:predicted metal-dependent hydrolase